MYSKGFPQVFHIGNCGTFTVTMSLKGDALLDHDLKHATSCKALHLHDVDLWKADTNAASQGVLGSKLMGGLGPMEESKDTVCEPSSKNLNISECPGSKLTLRCWQEGLR